MLCEYFSPVWLVFLFMRNAHLPLTSWFFPSHFLIFFLEIVQRSWLATRTIFPNGQLLPDDFTGKGIVSKDKWYRLDICTNKGWISLGCKFNFSFHHCPFELIELKYALRFKIKFCETQVFGNLVGFGCGAQIASKLDFSILSSSAFDSPWKINF